MSIPVYVLLPEGVEWSGLPGSQAQAPSAVRWYLRQHMLDAATQTAVLVEGAGDELASRIAAVASQAEALDGVAVDAGTQERIDPARSIPVT